MAERHRAGVAIVTLCVRGAPARTLSDNPKRLELLREALLMLSAALGGFAVGAAHFGRLPERWQAPLAASHVPVRHLAEGNRRRAWRHFPADQRPVAVARRKAAVLRLYLFED